MASDGQRFFELLKKRESLEGMKIFRMLLNLATSQYAVNRNYHELSSAIAKYEVDLKIWDVKNRALLNAFLRELSRLLQNYLSSIYSLIEHNREFCKDLNCAELNKAYSEEKETLLSNDCVNFIRDLRTFSQHIGLPLLSGQISFSKSEFKQRILLQKEELFKWKKWKRASEKYINSHEEIDLKLVLNEYQSLINNFYKWFYKKVTELYAEQLKELTEVESELARLNR